MSRNKTIKLLHEVTLKSYAECRAALKRNHWDFVTTYYFMNGGIDLNEFSKSFANFAENLTQAMTNVCEGLAHVFDGVAESLRHFKAATPTNKILLEDFEKLEPNAQREILGLKPVNCIEDDYFNYSDTVTAPILNPSEVRTNCIVEDFKIAEMENRGLFEPLSIDELREQFGLNPIEANDQNLPVACPDYATQDKNGKLYQNEDEGI